MAAGAQMPSILSSTTPPLLPHQLVARDRRSSYIKRVDTLAGPGAYVIPSTFKTTEMNAHIREVHKQQYGREFARQQRRAMIVSESAATEEPSDSKVEAEFSGEDQRDRYLARRERLRELLEKLDERQDHSDNDEVAASPTQVIPLTSESLPQSPSLSCTSNFEVFVEGYGQHQKYQQKRHSRVGSCTRTMSVQSPTSPTSGDFASLGFRVESPHQRHCASATTKQGASPATSPDMAPLTYRQYLSMTSYRKRHQRRSNDHSTGGSTARLSSHHHPTH